MKLKGIGLSMAALGSAALVVACATAVKDSAPSSRGESAGGANGRNLASLQDPEMIPFEKEFSDAHRFSAMMARSDRNDVAGGRLSVLIRWLRADPARVRDDLDRLNQEAAQGRGSVVGFYRSRAARRAHPTEIVTSYGEAVEILANSGDFESEAPAFVASRVPARTDDPLLRTITEKRAEIEGQVDALVERLINERSYEGRDLQGRAFARIDVIDSLGRLLPYLHNTAQLGLRDFGYESAVYWGRNWRDAIEFNLEGDRRMDARAAQILADVRRRKAEIGSWDERDLLNAISRAELIQASVAHVLDVVLRRPEALQAAREAVARGDEAAFEAVIAEALRLNPVRPLAVRIAKRNARLSSGREIVTGRAVLVLLAAANRDADAFTGPDQFDARRSPALAPLGLAMGTADAAGALASLETKAILRALLRRPGLRAADGDHGRIDRRNMIQPGTSFASDEFRYTFPEKLAVEWDIGSPSDRIQVANHHYLYESYLQDFDRAPYRLCLSAQLPEKFRRTPVAQGIERYVVPAIVRGIRINRMNVIARENQDLFFCRLNAPFRECVLGAERRDGFHHLEASEKHAQAAAECQRSHPLTPMESAFYDSVMLARPFDPSKLDRRQSRRSSGADYEFEDHLVFYNRYTARESMLNPVGMIQFKDKDRDLLFYVRLNLDFRGCMGKTVALHNVGKRVGIDVGRDRPSQYEVCKDGVWSQAALRREGRLSRVERYYYERLFLGRDTSFNETR